MYAKAIDAPSKVTPVGVFQLKRIIVVYLQSSMAKKLPEIAPSRQHPSRRVRENGELNGLVVFLRSFRLTYELARNLWFELILYGNQYD
jgi:hypothetical protein